MPLSAGVTENCKFIATKSLVTILATIITTIEPFALAKQPIDFNFLSPLVTFLVYKAAVIVTRGLLVDGTSHDGMRKLKVLRKFLKIVGERWLGCGELRKT